MGRVFCNLAVNTTDKLTQIWKVLTLSITVVGSICIINIVCLFFLVCCDSISNIGSNVTQAVHMPKADVLQCYGCVSVMMTFKTFYWLPSGKKLINLNFIRAENWFFQ